MEGFTVIDGVSVFVLAVSGLLAYSRGFLREVLSIVGWVVAAVAAFMFAGDVEPLMREIPVVGEVIGNNCELGIIVAAALVFVAALVVASIFTPLISGLVQNSALGSLDQGLGFLFGLARGALLIVVALIVYDRVIAGGEGTPVVENSRTIEILAQAQAQLAEALPEDGYKWITDHVQDLLGPCNGGLDSAENPEPPATNGQTAPAE